jgi:hypothetical protein
MVYKPRYMLYELYRDCGIGDYTSMIGRIIKKFPNCGKLACGLNKIFIFLSFEIPKDFTYNVNYVSAIISAENDFIIFNRDIVASANIIFNFFSLFRII